MKLTLKISVFFILICNYCFSQQNIPFFDLHKKVSFFVDLEHKYGSSKFETNTNYVSFDDSAQPLIFRRKEKELPDLLVFYKFSKNDSLVSEIMYEWDISNFDKSDNKKMPKDFDKKLIKKYFEIQKHITSVYGKSTAEGSLEDLSKINEEDGLERKDTWTPNDSLKIKMYTSISNYYDKKGAVTTSPTHRIRVSVNYINNNKETMPLGADRAHDAEKVFNQFINHLAEENFEAAKNLLSDKIKASVTPDILSQIKATIVNGSQVETYMSGLQMMQDVNQYLMIQFRYTDDKNMPPLEYIKVIYDQDNTILGIQPMKRG